MVLSTIDADLSIVAPASSVGHDASSADSNNEVPHAEEGGPNEN